MVKALAKQIDDAVKHYAKRRAITDEEEARRIRLGSLFR